MRIGLLTTSFPRGKDDAAGSFVLGFARALSARGHALCVLAPDPHEAHYQAPPEFAGLDVHWVRYLAPRSLQRTFYGAGVLDNLREQPLSALGLMPFTLALASAVARERHALDALVSHWALPCALVAGELAGERPHLAVLHSADVFMLEKLPLRRLLATRIATRARALAFSSRDLRRRFLALLDPLRRGELAQRAHVCAMGIEPRGALDQERSALRRRLGARHFTLLSLGRLVPIKGLVHAIEAMALLPEAELVIAGYGPDRPALEQAVRRTGARVRFVGALYGAEKHDWLGAADLFLLPSILLPSGRSEGMPTTVLEAMEHGLPVVASDVGGLSDVVRSGENGMLVAPGEPRAIAEGVRSLMQRSRHARASKGARETAQLYHWSTLAPLFEQLLLEPR